MQPAYWRRLVRPVRPMLIWVARGMVTLGLVLALLASPMACTTRVVPPVIPPGQEATTVLLIDYDRTPGLVLPDGEGGYDRWVYGDWQWYALANGGFLRAFPTLFWPTQGALGREEYRHDVSITELKTRLETRAQHVYTLQVPADRATALQQHLESIFERNRHTLVQQPGQATLFVYHPDRYTYFGNSNHKVANWLRELGAQVRGPSFYSKWSIEAPE